MTTNGMAIAAIVSGPNAAPTASLPAGAGALGAPLAAGGGTLGSVGCAWASTELMTRNAAKQTKSFIDSP